METGSRLRLRGEGEEGEHGGPNGDLYVFIEVEPHEIFERNGDDIYCRVPITFAQAALGGSVEAPTLTGTEKLKIPRGTQTGRIFRLKGKGIAHLRGYGRGDQIIETVVTVPTNLTKKQEELLREFDRLSSEAANTVKTVRFDNPSQKGRIMRKQRRLDRIAGHGRFSDLRLRSGAGRRCGGGRRFGHLLLHQRRDENGLLLTPSTRPGAPAKRPLRICAVWMSSRTRRSGREKSTAVINDEKVQISVTYKAKNVTTVSIRVGLIGNKLSSQLIHDKIGDNLAQKVGL